MLTRTTLGFRCDLCNNFATAFSTDDGKLICAACEATGLIILDEMALDRVEQVREFASTVGLRDQFEGQLARLNRLTMGDYPCQCLLYTDFAPHSFGFSYWTPAVYSRSGKREFQYHGGLIYQGPGCPGDGSFPSLSVNLSSGAGWFCHT
jgi:hypothetical protein